VTGYRNPLPTSPGQWLLGQRLDAARVRLERTDLAVEAVATRVGLASAVNLRRRFRAHLGTAPGAYPTEPQRDLTTEPDVRSGGCGDGPGQGEAGGEAEAADP
jgi:transcriptional regulator GlxA family with amidase domain